MTDHFAGLQQPMGQLMVHDNCTGEWLGPWTLLWLGQGYACVQTPQGPRWFTARNIRPVIMGREPVTDDQEQENG